MQRIWITGSSGCGKTTLANLIGKKLNIPVFNNDKIFWMENWQERLTSEQIELTKKISETDRWIYEGNRFNHCHKDGRYSHCDTIIYININRFVCLYRFLRRYFKYRGTVRPDITNGCIEKVDLNIIKYILLDYPKKEKERKKLFSKGINEGKQVILLTGRKGVQKWFESL